MTSTAQLPHPSTLSVSDWFLFDDVPRSARAAAELSTAAVAAMAAPSQADALVIARAAMWKWSACGACDSEPRNVMYGYIESVFGIVRAGT